MNPIIELQGIEKIYHIGGEDFAALAGITLNIEEGEFAALMGPSGSGKSTLMNILGCLDRPTAGSYQLGGKEVAHLNDDELAVVRNQHIGFVFQNFNLLSRITALDNVALPLVYAGVGRKERTERAMDKLKSVGLETWAHHKPNELSGGQRQRVAVARALALNPEVIVLDEAVSALDVLVQNQILYLLNDLQAELGLSYLFITHDLAVVRQIADDVIVMEKGKLVEANSTDELFNNPVQDYTRELIEAVPGRNIQLNL